MPALVAAILLAASTGDAAPAKGAGASQHRPVIVAPDWVKPPTGDDMAHAYPPAAVAARVSGKVNVRCKVRIDGGVDRCAVVLEDPPAWGFGEATLKVMPELRMRPKTVDGVPVDGGEVVIPFNWAPNNPATAPKPVDPPPTIAEAQARDQEALALARRIAELTVDYDWAAAQIRTSYDGWIYPMFDRQDAVRSAAFAEAFRTSLDDFAAERRDRVAASLVFTFSREELKDIKAFLETHAGAAFVRSFPVAMARSYGRSEELLAAFVDAWQTRFCGKVACDDRDLNRFTSLRTFYAGQHPPAPKREEEQKAQ
jgi:TonB family protein